MGWLAVLCAPRSPHRQDAHSPASQVGTLRAGLGPTDGGLGSGRGPSLCSSLDRAALLAWAIWVGLGRAGNGQVVGVEAPPRRHVHHSPGRCEAVLPTSWKGGQKGT